MTKMCRRTLAIKNSPFGRDMLDILIENQLKQVDFCELDVPKAIVTLKSALVNQLARPYELRYLYPVYFDAARVLLAEYVAEFFRTGKIIFMELDLEFWEYIDHETRQIAITERELDSLLRVLCRVQNTDHHLCARWQDPADRARWREHIQRVYDVLMKLK